MIVVDETEPDEDLEAPFPPRNVEVKLDEDMQTYYDLQNEIGRGRFGTVYLCNDKKTNQNFAAKFVNTKRNQDRENVEREIEIMKLLNKDKPHPLMIQLYDAYDCGKEMCLILEIVDGGELFERVIDDDFVLTERACAIFVKQICQALEFIHSKNVLHLDMKPENILCLSREGNRVKICDFGLARKFDPKKKLQVLFGTPEFVAPEVVNFEPISFGTDMWSVGVITYVLLSGLSPFMGHDYVETMTNVTKNKYDFDDEAFDTVSEESKDFIRLLLVPDKSLRPPPEQCYRHPWLKKLPTKRASNKEAISESEDEKNDSSIEEKFRKEEREKEKDINENNHKKENGIEIIDKELRKSKSNLKDFVERWTSQPNSPCNVKTLEPIKVDAVKEEKKSPDYVASVAVCPSVHENRLDLDDEIDDDDKDEFTCYKIEPPKSFTNLSPEDMVKHLEEKLAKLKNNNMRKDDIPKKSIRVETDLNKNSKSSIMNSNELSSNKENQINTKEEGKKVLKDESKKVLDVKTEKIEESPLQRAKAEAQKALEESRKYKEQVLNIQEQSKKAQDDIKRLREREEARRGILNKDIENNGNIPRDPIKRPESPTVQKDSIISTKYSANSLVSPTAGSNKPIAVEVKEAIEKANALLLTKYDRNSPIPKIDIKSLSTTTATEVEKKDSETIQNSNINNHSTHQYTSRDVPIPIQVRNTDRQKTSRDVPHLLEPTAVRRGSRDSNAEKSSPNSRKTSESEGPYSHETDRASKERTPVPNTRRRPSRDMPLSGAELEHLSIMSFLGDSDAASNTQIWPDLMLAPQEDTNTGDSYSLQKPVNRIEKSPSGTILHSTSEKNDNEINKNTDKEVSPQRLIPETKSEIKSKNDNEKSDKLDSNYVAPKNLVAWILDIGTTQAQNEQRQTPLSDRVNLWEQREKLSRTPSPSPNRCKSPLTTSRPVSPFGQVLRKDKSSTNLSTSNSSINLQSSPSTDDLVIQTPWGPVKRSPSRTNISRSSSGNRLSKSPSIDVPSNKSYEDSIDKKDHNHLSSTRSLTRSPSPMSISTIESSRSNVQSPNSIEMMEPKSSKSSLRTIDEPSRLSEKNYLEPKYNSLPRSAKLSKTSSSDSISSARSSSFEKGKKTSSIDSIKEIENDTLKRKSKTPLPPLPGQKKGVGLPSLFSAKERISLFEQKKETRPPQRPFTRTRSNVVFDKYTSAEKALENRHICDENKNPVTPIVSSKSNNTQIEYLLNRFQNKSGKPSNDIIHNSDSVNSNLNNNINSKRSKYATLPRTQKETINT